MDSNESTRIHLQRAIKKLQGAQNSTPQQDITAILSGLFRIPRYRAVTGDFTLVPEEWKHFHELIKKRTGHEPLQYILGKCNFWKSEFFVTPDVLIPRPETEHLVETALEHLPSDAERTVVDCCTGSGCVAVSLALERPMSQVIGCDISPAALRTAEKNRRYLLAANCHFLASDMLASFSSSSVNLITANPPYVAVKETPSLQPELSFEPREALFSEDDGLAHIRSLLEQAPAILKKNGCLAFEFGYNQGEAIPRLVESTASRTIRQFKIIKDLGGHERIGLIQYA
ncbi:MAG: peptide chain release factor N(5)-glutamine methyltransferase [Acidobacteria bacterium]|nr:peptide chain release factor N(5)-glutamine methyltransferase [Acidobacteriota bacterium]